MVDFAGAVKANQQALTTRLTGQPATQPAPLQPNTAPGSRTPVTAAAPTTTTNPNSAPPTAAAAPKANNQYNALGLCEYLNDKENDLVKHGNVRIANSYEVQFVPASLGSAKVKIPGQTDKSLSPAQNTDSAKSKVDPNTNSMNTQAMIKGIPQGMQIVQFIDLVMRNSTYITGQQITITDSVSGNSSPSSNAAGVATGDDKSMKWFKISAQVTPSDNFDNLRHTYAYHMTYVVSEYGINEMISSVFPDAKFRGVHKVYNYWFTGENTQILNYEQNFNTLWYYPLMYGIKDPKQNVQDTPQSNQIVWNPRGVPVTRSDQTDQSAPNGALNPASAGADSLYSFSDQANINLKIIGDPAWIQQGEIIGVAGRSFNFHGFYPDGTINTDSGQAIIVVNWNAPADYNLDNGLVNINAAGTGSNNNNLMNAQTQASAAYNVITIKSVFKKGEFYQELTGALLRNLTDHQIAQATGAGTGDGQSANNAGSTTPSDSLLPKPTLDLKHIDPTLTPPTSTRTPLVQTSQITNPAIIDFGKTPAPTWSPPINSDAQAAGGSSVISKPSPQPAAAAGAPTSNKSVVAVPMASNGFPDTMQSVNPVTGKPGTLATNLTGPNLVTTKTQTMAAKDQ